MARGPGFCPSCGERVSSFAAGCAICGADLDPGRHDRSRLRLPNASAALGPVDDATRSDLVLAAVLVALTLFATLLGLLLALYAAYSGDREGRPAKRALSLAVAAVCVFLLVNPVAQIDLLSRLGVA